MRMRKETAGKINQQKTNRGYRRRVKPQFQSEKRETALRLSKMGLSVKQIAQATELSEDDVLKLIQK